MRFFSSKNRSEAALAQWLYSRYEDALSIFISQGITDVRGICTPFAFHFCSASTLILANYCEIHAKVCNEKKRLVISSLLKGHVIQSVVKRAKKGTKLSYIGSLIEDENASLYVNVIWDSETRNYLDRFAALRLPIGENFDFTLLYSEIAADLTDLPTSNRAELATLLWAHMLILSKELPAVVAEHYTV